MNLIETRLNSEITIGVHQAAPDEPVSVFEIKNNGSFRSVMTLTPDEFARFIKKAVKERMESL